MLRLSELKLSLDHSEEDLQEAICRRLRIPPTALRSHRLVKRSVDARRRGAIALVYSLDLELDLDTVSRKRLERRFADDPHLRPTPDERYRFVARVAANDRPAQRPVVVGAGPCGYFAALLLAQMGLRPLLLERGKAVKERSADTFGFWKGRQPFDPESNAQFGEGGAGTFSDGKLYSQVSEPAAYGRKVLEELVAAGAHEEILTLHRPHIGTFKLATVVRGLRKRIEDLGGTVRFGARVERLLRETDADGNGQLRGLVLADGEVIASEHMVLAIGHSARDTFAMLRESGVELESKPFAVGLRIEHPQALIDRGRWGAAAGHPRLGPAEYKLVHHGAHGRDVYSFCMCPGGLVVGATSENGCVVTNGMSQHSRNERNANSALVVTITTADVEPYGEGPGDPLAGVAFQQHWERRAFLAGGGDYRAPAQWLEDFLQRRPSSAEAKVGVNPSYLPGVRLGSLEGCLPQPVLEAIRQALPAFERRIPGYTGTGVLLTGVETRTSSPVRIPRDPATRQSRNTRGLYPAGEGAGYAGGILSAAIDGIQVAEALALNLLHPPLQGARDGSACGPA
ncbi:FAD-dependent oxidoreductase [Cyanobium sp. FGCU-6]|nr:FAD-dependent oxidoreductase [Cyanobium sp. FGCU6]